MWVIAQSVQLEPVQRLPLAYGWTTHRAIEAHIMRSYTEPVAKRTGVRRDLARLLRAVDTRYTYEAAATLRGFEKPALVLWAADDMLFPHEHGRRLAERLPQGSYEEIPESRTFIPEDQPGRLGSRLRRFLEP
jgi:pimeloyl-ACP methyl ester carboxylesterase